MRHGLWVAAALCCAAESASAAGASGSGTSTSTAPASADRARLVKRVLDAYGGHAALERARVVREEGTVTSTMRGETGRLTRTFARPLRLRVEIAYPNTGPEVRVVQGPYGKRDGREVSGSPMHAAMVLQAARLALPLSLAASDARITDGGTVERDGHSVRLLTLALPDGMELAVEIDPASARIVRSSGSMAIPGAGRIAFTTEYSSFRSFGGVLFATHEENYARGQHTGATELTRVEILREAPPGTFDEAL